MEDFHRSLSNSDDQPRAEVNAVIREVIKITAEEKKSAQSHEERKNTMRRRRYIDLIISARDIAAVNLTNGLQQMSYQR